MRRPGFWIIVGLLLGAAGAALSSSALMFTQGMPVWYEARRLYQTLSFVGFVAVLGGLVLAAIAFVVQRKRNALERGEGVIARWRVGLLDWDAFRRRDLARDGLFGSLRNRLRLPAELPPEGMEVRIGTDAMLIGDGCYGLGYFASRGKLVDVALVDGRPAMLEFTTHQTGKNSSRIVVFRVPVPDMDRAQAQAVLDHFNGTIGPALRDRAHSRFARHFQAATGDAGEAAAARAEERSRNWAGIGLSLLLVGGAIFVLTTIQTSGPSPNPAVMQLITIGSGIAALVGLLALAWSILGRR